MAFLAAVLGDMTLLSGGLFIPRGVGDLLDLPLDGLLVGLGLLFGLLDIYFI